MSVNKNLHSKTALTEFARDQIEDESRDTVLSKLVNKIYDACNNTQEQVPEQAIESDKKVEKPEPQPSSSKVEEKTERPKQIEPVVEYQVDTSLGRTPLNVVKRISNLLAMKDKDLNDYKNTELQKLWMPDSKSIECYDCNLKFNTFRRKHHCRLCGQIFCSKCCSTLVPGKIIMVTGELRVCNYCSKVILSYIKSPDIAQDLKSDLQALEENLSSKFVTGTDSTSANAGVVTRSPYRKASVGYQEERLVSSTTNALSNADRKNILQQSHSLKALYEDMIKTQNQFIKGSELVSYLISSQKCVNKQQAHEILNAMVEGAFIIPVITEVEGVENSNPADFSEIFVYRLSKIEEIGNVIRPDSISEGPEMDEIMPPSLNSESLLYPNQSEELECSIMATAAAKPHLGKFFDHLR
jgi:1-phosphatidylinositol-3-phosphate 5-kinase